MTEFDVPPSKPLVVDLDGTLLRTDLLHESALRLLRQSPTLVFALPGWLAGGKAILKRRIAERVSLDASTLPYDERVVDWIREQRKSGRRVVLCTASDEKYAHEVAEHLRLFDEVIASDGITNFSSERKAEKLRARFGDHGFDYAGNSSADIPVWKRARNAIVVSASSAVSREAHAAAKVEREFERPRASLRTWAKALRLHQWLKNLLLFLPLLGAHQILNLFLLQNAAIAFLSFGLCASSVYVLNDLMDLESDRRHPRKRQRPFAAGKLSSLAGLAACALLLTASFALAFFVGPMFLFWLGVYLLVTLAYTFWLKRKALVDVLSLAGLYTLRIIAGGAAVGLTASFWLLAFSLFLFLSLAFVKRYSELKVMLEQGEHEAHGRGYRAGDLSLVEVMGVVAGFSAVLVMALYINGETVVQLYAHAELMWLIVPVLLYWISRMWLKAHRGEMHDDPVLYAVRDPVSLVCGATFLGILWVASLQW